MTKKTRIPRTIDIKYVGCIPQTHTIKCRFCSKESIVSLRYTRACNDCRNSAWYNSALKEASQWSGWQNQPYIGQSLIRVVRRPVDQSSKTHKDEEDK